MNELVIGLDHIDIVVGDTEIAAEFFAKLGFSVVRRLGDGRGSIELRFPGSDIILELTPSLRADGRRLPLGLRHMALRCSDLDAAVSAFTAAGLAIPEGPRLVAATGRRVANTTMPDNQVLQFTE